ncbi:hypothetical protein LR48_Vigan10g176800 [Vigna angularis]|uniref:Uncharacterized protein n=1 Tax=Phaseolus angularis TaxID=3914 RepID=A0A0L9VLD4_PHAAN|nr:hypothetical protein LR48_Vigan10g176800 [Vigna angularis]
MLMNKQQLVKLQLQKWMKESSGEGGNKHFNFKSGLKRAVEKEAINTSTSKEEQGKNSNTEAKPSTTELEDDESGKDRTRRWCINGGNEAQKNAERRRRSEDAEACGEKKTDVDGSNGCSGRSEQREGGSVRRLALARFDIDAEKATRDEHASEIYRRVEARDSACR